MQDSHWMDGYDRRFAEREPSRAEDLPDGMREEFTKAVEYIHTKTGIGKGSLEEAYIKTPSLLIEHKLDLEGSIRDNRALMLVALVSSGFVVNSLCAMTVPYISFPLALLAVKLLDKCDDENPSVRRIKHTIHYSREPEEQITPTRPDPIGL